MGSNGPHRPAPSWPVAGPVTRFGADPGWLPVDLEELWQHRELIWFLTWREVKVRYKQTLLGFSWAILKPLMTMVVFTFLLTALLGADNLPSEEGIPYALSTYCGLVPWQLFARSLVASTQSLVGNRHLLTKVYFPRLILPTTPVLASLVDFLLALTVLVGLMVYYGVKPGPALLALPLFTLLAMASALAVAVWLAPLNAVWRDIGHGIGFLSQLWMYATPVVYTAASVMAGQPDWLQFLYGLNPMAGVSEGFRWALLGGAAPSFAVMAWSTALVVGIGILGLFFFRRMEHVIADLV